MFMVCSFSRRFGGGGSGRFGGAKDQFWITDEGKAAAARLETQLRGQTGGLAALSPTAAAAAAGGTPCRAAAAAGYNSSRFAAAGYAGRTGGGHDANDDDDPFAALLGGFLQGPEFTGNPAAAAAAASAGRHQLGQSAAAANTSPFSGRGHVLGQGSSHHAAAAAGVGAAAAAAGRGAAFDPADYVVDDDDLDADGFQIYRQEWFEDHHLSPPPPPASRQLQAADSHKQPAAAAAAIAPANRSPVTAAATPAAATSSRGLIPKTRKWDKREPLCDDTSGCTPCRSLREFLSESTSSTLLMTLTKTKQQHVQQRVAYLVSPEGGQWPLTVTVENGRLVSDLSWPLFVIPTCMHATGQYC